MNRTRAAVLWSALSLALALPASAAPAKGDPFAENVRPTGPLTPQDELKAFRLPPGFEIQLVASEPEIHKPLNLAFDGKGRLWVTSTQEYPYPVKGDAKGRDKVLVLEINARTGHADKVTTFAEGLNIPIGVYPYKDGCIAYSIPNIYAFRDTDGDGRADQQQLLYGPYDTTRDTHGLTSSFTRGFDGWLYADHGFNNHSTIKGADGSAIDMVSGNVYRMALDGSHLDHVAHGPVNPFGLTFDRRGNLYVADCHTKPVQQVLRGAWYEHFGRPHDGLGFSPQMMNHLHGSTAIGGLVYYGDDRWPGEFQDNIITGNPVTSRIDRDAVTYAGSSPKAEERPDFVGTDDPWFRPVYMKLGPDGAVYVADFYNKIIGHYEVPLTHPGRDRDRGRIWRITWKGTDPAAAPPDYSMPDLSRLDAEGLAAKLAAANQSVRMLAADELTDRLGGASAPAVEAALAQPANADQRVHCLWVLHRLGVLDAAALASAAGDADALVRTHALQVFAETKDWSPPQRRTVLAALADADPFVRRNAAAALALHPDPANVKPLLALRASAPASDPYLVYATRISLRAQLAGPGSFAALPAGLAGADLLAVADVAVAVNSEEAGAFLARNLAAVADKQPALLESALKQAVRFAPAGETDALVKFAMRRYEGDVNAQLGLFKSVQEASVQRGTKLGDAAVVWGGGLAAQVLGSPARDKAGVARRLAAVDVIKSLKLADLDSVLWQAAAAKGNDATVRAAALKALVSVNPSLDPAPLARLLADPAELNSLRDAAAQALGEVNSPASRDALFDALKAAPQGLGTRIALALAGTPEGAEALLKAAAAGKASPRLLQERPVADRLAATKVPDLAARLTALTQGLPAPDQQAQAVIDARKARYEKVKADPARADPAKGQKVFAANCLACHSIDGQGKNVGPSLDGVGVRGLDRLCEDVLDPNRNVDPAFFAFTVTLKDRTVLTGLLRREVGESAVFADSTGQEITVARKDIARKTESRSSLMPTNFSEVIPPEDFDHLLAYLLSKSNRPPTP